MHTPHLDALGRASVRFTNFTVHPVCAPSRAALMTGRHFLRTGVSHVHGGKDFLHVDEITLAQVLRANGYATGMWGKWHLGTTPGYCPWERGFDEAYMAHLYLHRATHGLLNGTPVEHDQWADEVIVDYAIDFIRRHRTQPWFAYVPSMTPHGPHDAPREYIERFTQQGLSEPLARIYAMIAHFDEQLGRLLRMLDEEGLNDTTVVLFMSDNGPAIDRGELSDADRAVRSWSGLRGWKGDIWENGVRSPLFIRCGKHIAPHAVDDVVQMPDIFPTVLELAGSTLPANYPALDGRSILSVLARDGSAAQEHDVFNYSSPGWPSGIVMYTPDGIRNEYNPVAPEDKAHLPLHEQVVSVRRGPWKLLMNPQINDDPAEIQDVWLVHLEHDPGEHENLAARHPDIAAELRRELEAWWRAIVHEPHSFSAPFYTVPCRPGEKLTIRGTTPYRCSATLRNTVPHVKGWHAAGQSADYHVKAAGVLEIRAHVARALAVDARWRIVADDAGSVETTVSAATDEIIFPHITVAGMETVRLELASVAAPISSDEGAWLDRIMIRRC